MFSVPLTKTDELNNYEWKGYTDYMASSHRTILLEKWDLWRDGSPYRANLLGVPLEKRSGKWYIFGLDASKFSSPSQIDCAKVLRIPSM